MIELLLFLTGLLVATICSLVGLGGGIFIVPILVLGFGLKTQHAIGISLLMMTFTTVSATIAYARQKRVNYKVGVLLDVFDVPGAIFGAFVTTLLSSNILAGLFGCLLIIISIHIIKKNKNDGEDVISCGGFNLSKRAICLCLLTSFVSGFVAGMLGAGGGTIDMIAMVLVLGMSPYIATGTSEFGMALTNTAALIPHIFLGNVVLQMAVPITIGAVIGAQLGPSISRRMKVATLRKILGAVLIVVGIRMLATLFTSV
ncbi:sulfite exporter TauE/SafE family protein [Candidatus Bathyarchaeota archaeon]|nr:sulfite exporter TauE/SafE family protein [Candidatus Bathyarchaeota archaeon]